MTLLSSIKKIFPSKKRYTLVISGGGVRGFYALGILKGLEERGLKDRIQAIYGVSAGAILASYRTAGYSAQQIFDKFFDIKKFFSIYALNILSKKSLLKLNHIEKIFAHDLPKNISDLQKKIYIGATDTKTAKFVLFDHGDLIPILLGSIAIPGIFPVVPYQKYLLMDGGTTNNFPIEFAKKKYPNNEIIGIALNKFKENQNVNDLFDSLSIAFEILMRHDTLETLSSIAHPFCRELPVKILDTNKKNMQKAYDLGYQDCMMYFN